MDSPIATKFGSAVEAAAYLVCVNKMCGQTVPLSIEGNDEKTEWVVKLTSPIPMETHIGILSAIAKDKRDDPVKWSDQAILEKHRKGD